jgi:hypothetical protein
LAVGVSAVEPTDRLLDAAANADDPRSLACGSFWFAGRIAGQGLSGYRYAIARSTKAATAWACWSRRSLCRRSGSGRRRSSRQSPIRPARASRRGSGSGPRSRRDRGWQSGRSAWCPSQQVSLAGPLEAPRSAWGACAGGRGAAGNARPSWCGMPSSEAIRRGPQPVRRRCGAEDRSPKQPDRGDPPSPRGRVAARETLTVKAPEGRWTVSDIEAHLVEHFHGKEGIWRLTEPGSTESRGVR